MWCSMQLIKDGGICFSNLTVLTTVVGADYTSLGLLGHYRTLFPDLRM